MNGAHVAGGSLGAILAVILAALGKKIGLTLTGGESATLAIGLLGVGAGVGHAAQKLYMIGVGPLFVHLWRGAKK